MQVYDHSKITINDATEDYYITGWVSKTTGIAMQTRIIFREQKS